MQISPGTRLGPYEILAPIGAGGMGEVWKARDSRLDRSVAIKVLPDEFAGDPTLRRRFEREAKTISQLNHPHICTLYDAGSENGVEYLIMELLEGETLAQRIARGPLPFADVVKYGAQIADALDRAHRAGVIHRDLKPGNVMITRSGAKLLDFGLAKSEAAAISSPDAPTALNEQPLTSEGTILGTFQYMAPEQIEGREADSRTDIFALGCVLYEMATGNRPFEAKTRPSLIAAILGTEPRPMRELVPQTPPLLEHLVVKCLAKDPEERWQCAHDVGEQLRWIGSGSSDRDRTTHPASPSRGNRWVIPLVTAAAAALLTWSLVSSTAARPRRTETSILPPETLRFDLDNGRMALSPDGSSLAFTVSDPDGRRFLVVRSLVTGRSRRLPGTEDGVAPFWSPDGEQLGFFARGKLKTVSLTGGAVNTLCDARHGRGGSWGAAGSIVFTPAIGSEIFLVPATGGSPRQVTRLAATETGHRWPAFLPDGKHFLFSARDARTGGAIWVASVDGTQKKKVTMDGTGSAAFAPPDRLLFFRDGSLMAQRFDLRGHELSGAPVVVAQGVAHSGISGSLFSVSDRGDLAYQRGAAAALGQLTWYDRQGRQGAPVTAPGLFYAPRISRDGLRVAVDKSALTTGLGDIWVFHLDRGVSNRLTFDPQNDTAPVWSADDKEIIYATEKEGRLRLQRIPAGGVGDAKPIGNTSGSPTDVSPDSAWIVFNAIQEGGTDIRIYSSREGKTRNWLQTPFTEGSARISPDGRWIAYHSDESGDDEIYVRSFPESQEKWRVSKSGGTMPVWSRDGRELFYVAPDGMLMAVPVTITGTSFDARAPAPLFRTDLLRAGLTTQYDAGRDGRFLINRQISKTSTPVTLVQNWAASLNE